MDQSGILNARLDHGKYTVERGDVPLRCSCVMLVLLLRLLRMAGYLMIVLVGLRRVSRP